MRDAQSNTPCFGQTIVDGGHEPLELTHDVDCVLREGSNLFILSCNSLDSCLKQSGGTDEIPRPQQNRSNKISKHSQVKVWSQVKASDLSAIVVDRSKD